MYLFIIIIFPYIYSELKWSEQLKDVIMEPFVETVGPNLPLAPDITVLGLFRLFFTTTLMASIVAQTNTYARTILGEDPRWEDVTESEIWAFFGFCVLMGVNRLPALHHYWSADPHFHYHPIATRIPRARFLSIWRFLHFVDNRVHEGCLSSPGAQEGERQGPPPDLDRLWKVRPVISAVVAACRTLYRPNREASIDEAMVAFKGRSSMKQYLPMKPVKRGFKIWVRADSHNGYISRFECYTGKKGDTTEVGLGGKVVERLTRDLVGKNYHIYMDNFFSSVSLYKSLLRDKIYCTGTLRSNRRYFPSELKPFVKKGLAKRGDSIVRQEGNTCVLVWQDTRPVVSISTGHNPAETKVVKRGRGKKMVYVDCPSCIFDYNRFMGGVDRGDQLRHYYRVRVKSCKSYKYIIWFVFEVCILNSFILSKYTQCTHNRTFLSFRQELARQLIGNYNGRKRRTITRTVIHHNLVCSVAHYPHNLGSCNRGLCKFPGCNFQTVWYCDTCDKRLCHGKHNDCFSRHHAQHNLFTQVQ